MPQLARGERRRVFRRRVRRPRFTSSSAD